MLNVLWGSMMLIGILWGMYSGNLSAVTDGILESAKEAVALCISMLGIMSFWSGILKIGEEAGLIASWTNKMKPIIRFLFPHLPEDHPASAHISTNMIANMLGLGWAATPAGLRAMEELKKLEKERMREKKYESRTSGLIQKKETFTGTANNEMCTFLILNISSLQLIPINMIAYRSQYGSANPSAIVGPAFLATMISTLAAVLFVKVIHNDNL